MQLARRHHRETSEERRNVAETPPGGASPVVSEPAASVTRRHLVGKAIGLAAVGAAGSSVLAEALASPAAAATGVETGAVAPTVVSLVDGPTISVDASLGNDFRVTLAASRTFEGPTNPTDGQKVIFQVTQGTTGSAAITWGSSYAFSAALPLPTLSTAPGATDLLAFVYNAAKGKWLLVAFVKGFPSTIVVPPTGVYRLFANTAGPSAASSYAGAFLAGVLFEATAGGTWLQGFWWWVCASGQSTAAQTFALWQVYSTRLGTMVASATATSATLVAGAWNYVPLSTPVPLASGATYVACTGFSGGFPITNNQFGSGQPYGGGIISGPLTAYSDQSGSLPSPFTMSQGLFGTTGTDPTTAMPLNGYSSANFWMDVQVTTTAPAGTSYRLWPNMPTVPGAASSDTNSYTIGTEVRLSQSCALNKIWYYSPASATILPTRCAIWDVSSQSEVSGTDATSPAWSGLAGSGWVSCSYSGVTLPPGDYKVTVYSPGGSQWYQAQVNYWSTGPGSNGIAAGPLSAPSTYSATGPGQCTYNQGGWTYPLTYSSAAGGENNWIDVEVTPA